MTLMLSAASQLPGAGTVHKWKGTCRTDLDKFPSFHGYGNSQDSAMLEAMTRCLSHLQLLVTRGLAIRATDIHIVEDTMHQGLLSASTTY